MQRKEGKDEENESNPLCLEIVKIINMLYYRSIEQCHSKLNIISLIYLN